MPNKKLDMRNSKLEMRNVKWEIWNKWGMRNVGSENKWKIENVGNRQCTIWKLWEMGNVGYIRNEKRGNWETLRNEQSDGKMWEMRNLRNGE